MSSRWGSSHSLRGRTSRGRSGTSRRCRLSEPRPAALGRQSILHGPGSSDCEGRGMVTNSRTADLDERFPRTLPIPEKSVSACLRLNQLGRLERPSNAGNSLNGGRRQPSVFCSQRPTLSDRKERKGGLRLRGRCGGSTTARSGPSTFRPAKRSNEHRDPIRRDVVKQTAIVLDAQETYARLLAPLNIRESNVHLFLTPTTKTFIEDASGSEQYCGSYNESFAGLLSPGRTVEIQVKTDFRESEIRKTNHVILRCSTVSLKYENTESNSQLKLLKVLREDRHGNFLTVETKDYERVPVSKHFFCPEEVLKALNGKQKFFSLPVENKMPQYVRVCRTFEGRCVETSQWKNESWQRGGVPIKKIVISLDPYGMQKEGFGRIKRYMADGIVVTPIDEDVTSTCDEIFFACDIESLSFEEKVQNFPLDSVFHYSACPELPNRAFTYVAYMLGATASTMPDCSPRRLSQKKSHVCIDSDTAQWTAARPVKPRAQAAAKEPSSPDQALPRMVSKETLELLADIDFTISTASAGNTEPETDRLKPECAVQKSCSGTPKMESQTQSVAYCEQESPLCGPMNSMSLRDSRSSSEDSYLSKQQCRSEEKEGTKDHRDRPSKETGHPSASSSPRSEDKSKKLTFDDVLSNKVVSVNFFNGLLGYPTTSNVKSEAKLSLDFIGNLL